MKTDSIIVGNVFKFSRSRGVPERFQGYVLKSLLENYRRSYECMNIPSDHYDHHFGKIFASLVEKSRFIGIDGGPKLDGFALFDDKCLHYVYIPKELRRRGSMALILRELGWKFDDPGCSFSFMTKAWWLIWRGNSARYLPFERFRHFPG